MLRPITGRNPDQTDCNFTHEQLMLRETARKLMQRVATPDYIRKLDREFAVSYAAFVVATFVASGLALTSVWGNLAGIILKH